MRMNKNWVFLIIGLVALLGFGQVARAGLSAVGPVDPTNGFPAWYQDANSLALIPCLSQTHSPNLPPNLMCVLLGDPTFNLLLPVIFPTNFPQESFYWIADANTTPTPGFTDLGPFVKAARFALESTFAAIPPTPANGEQLVFARVRFRIDPPANGIYKITHPFGVREFTGTAGIRINFTEDIPLAALDFTGALNGGIGPFLRWDTGYPIIIGNERFIGDPNVLHTVTGSPTGNNFVQIDGPAGSNLGGPGIDSVKTTHFSVAGKIFTGTLPTAVSVIRASYGRAAGTALGQVDVFATSTPTAALTVNGAGGIPTWPMTGDGTGKFFAHIPVTSLNPVPATLSVTADDSVDNPNNVPATVTANLQDLVTITQADYSAATGQLTVTANSSDLFVPPVLTLGGFTSGTLNNGAPTVFTTAAPPASINVSSSQGGSESQKVTVAAAAGSLAPVARNDAVHTLPNTAVDIPVLVNDLALVGALNTGSVLIGTAPTNGTAQANTPVAGQIRYTPNPLFSGVDTFTYTVADNQPLTSLPATVTVTVAAAPLAVNDTVVTSQNTIAVINILANDTVAAGLTLNPSTVVPVPFPTTAHGTISLNPGTGAVTYTPTLAYFGPDSFTYTVKDNLGTISNAATVNITVASPGPTAVNDFATTIQGQAVTIPVLANDLGALNFTTLAIALLPVQGLAAVNTLSGTITYTPPVGFTGQMTFTYTVRNPLGFVSNAATVTVTVNPIVETITVGKAEYNSRLGLWTIQGTTNAPVPPNNAMTIRIGSLAGTLLGTATVDATGNWVLNQANSAVPFNATVSIQSSYGTAVTGTVIRLR